MIRSLCLLIIIAGYLAQASDDGLPRLPLADRSEVVIREVRDGVLAVGSVELNKKDRSVTLDATVNMREGLIEYALVGEIGKVHESLLACKVKPQDLHMAILLLGATNRRPKSEETRLPPGHPVQISIESKIDQYKKTARLEDWIIKDSDHSVMRRGMWVYSGSRVSDGFFMARRDESFVSIILDIDALVNNPRPGNENDEIWVANQKVVPPVGTPVKVTIKLLDVYETSFDDLTKTTK